MENRNENVAILISDLKDPFYDTPDRFFVALAKKLINDGYSDDDIRRMVDKTVNNLAKTRLTIADVIKNAAKSEYEFMMNGKRCYGDKNNPKTLPEEVQQSALPRPGYDYYWNVRQTQWSRDV